MANSSILPLTCSAKAEATSLADCNINAYKQSLTLISSPTTAPILAASGSRVSIALCENVTVSSRLQFSMVSNAVMILVILAGYIFWWHFLSKSTEPVEASIITAVSATNPGPLGQETVSALTTELLLYEQKPNDVTVITIIMTIDNIRFILNLLYFDVGYNL